MIHLFGIIISIFGALGIAVTMCVVLADIVFKNVIKNGTFTWLFLSIFFAFLFWFGYLLK